LLPEKEADAEVFHWQNFFGIQLIRYRATKGHLKIDSFLKKLRDSVNVYVVV
jgi:hypothetical protein